MRAAAGDGATRTLAAFASDDHTRLGADLAGSATWLGLELERSVSGFQRGGVEDRYRQTFAGTAAEGLRPLSAVCPGYRYEGVRSIDADAARLAFRGPACEENSTWERGGEPRRAFPPGATGLRVAGGLVAWLEGAMFTAPESAAVVVADASTGAERLRLAPGALPGPVTDMELDDDGTVAILYSHPGPNGRESRLAVASPAAPRPRRLGGRIAEGVVRVAGGRVLALEELGRRGRRLVALDARSGRVLRAAPVRPSAEFPSSIGFDLDAGRIVSVVRHCRRVAIEVGSAPPDPLAEDARCRLRLVRRPVLSGRYLRLRISCAGFRVDCEARVTASLGTRTLTVRNSGIKGRVALRLTRASDGRSRGGRE